MQKWFYDIGSMWLSRTEDCGKRISHLVIAWRSYSCIIPSFIFPMCLINRKISPCFMENNTFFSECVNKCGAKYTKHSSFDKPYQNIRKW